MSCTKNLANHERRDFGRPPINDRHRLAHGRGGSIVITASASGLKAEQGIAAYGASKAGVLHLSRIAAKECAQHGIRVNAIAPAGVKTPIWRDAAFFAELVHKTGGEDEAFAALAKAGTPIGRFATA